MEVPRTATNASPGVTHAELWVIPVTSGSAPAGAGRPSVAASSESSMRRA